MKKILLFFVALTISIAVNAFSLSLMNLDATEPVSVKTDNPDVFGDGKVAVHFDVENNLIDIVLTNAYLSSGKDSYYSPFSFEGDDNYNTIRLHINGKCTIEAYKNSRIPIVLSSAVMNIVADGPGAKLNVSGDETLVSLGGDASLYIGNMLENVTDKPLYVYFYKLRRPEAVFKGSSSSFYTQELYFLFADVEIACEAGKTLIVNELEELGTISALDEDLKIEYGQLLHKGI